MVGDFNGDGNSDIAAINLTSGNVSLLLNNPNPNNPPVANDDEFTTLENEAFEGGKLFVNNSRGVDSDPDNDTLVVIEVNREANIGNQITLESGALLTVNSDGIFDYNPNGQVLIQNIFCGKLFHNSTMMIFDAKSAVYLCAVGFVDKTDSGAIANLSTGYDCS